MAVFLSGESIIILRRVAFTTTRMFVDVSHEDNGAIDGSADVGICDILRNQDELVDSFAFLVLTVVAPNTDHIAAKIPKIHGSNRRYVSSLRGESMFYPIF